MHRWSGSVLLLIHSDSGYILGSRWNNLHFTMAEMFHQHSCIVYDTSLCLLASVLSLSTHTGYPSSCVVSNRLALSGEYYQTAGTIRQEHRRRRKTEKRSSLSVFVASSFSFFKLEQSMQEQWRYLGRRDKYCFISTQTPCSLLQTAQPWKKAVGTFLQSAAS